MSKVIATTKDGSVQITRLTESFVAKCGGEDEALNAMANRLGGQIVDEAAIPTDRTFRDAWTMVGDTVAVDMVKARDIHRTRVGDDPRIESATTPDELKQITAKE